MTGPKKLLLIAASLAWGLLGWPGLCSPPPAVAGFSLRLGDPIDYADAWAPVAKQPLPLGRALQRGPLLPCARPTPSADVPPAGPGVRLRGFRVTRALPPAEPPALSLAIVATIPLPVAPAVLPALATGVFRPPRAASPRNNFVCAGFSSTL